MADRIERKKSDECRALSGVSNTMSPENSIVEKWAWFETMLVSACLSVMVLMVLCQIFLRNFFNSGITGGDAFVKHMVLWVAFIGAGLATRRDRHIRIDLASRFLGGRAQQAAQVLVSLFSIVICLVLLHAAIEFVAFEYRQQMTLPFMGIPVWIMEIVIPIGFGSIALRMGVRAVMDIIRWKKES